MRRVVVLAALSGVVGSGGQAAAQPPSSEEVRKLEAELVRLHAQLKEVEAQLQKAKHEAARREDRQPSPSGGDSRRGQMDPEELKKLLERSGARMDPDQIKVIAELIHKMTDEAWKDSQRSAPPWSDWSRGGGWSRGGWSERGRDHWRSPEPSKSTDIDKRLDRILKEVEELRQEIKKK
jgi:hypothetical protein